MSCRRMLAIIGTAIFRSASAEFTQTPSPSLPAPHNHTELYQGGECAVVKDWTDGKDAPGPGVGMHPTAFIPQSAEYRIGTALWYTTERVGYVGWVSMEGMWGHTS